MYRSTYPPVACVPFADETNAKVVLALGHFVGFDYSIIIGIGEIGALYGLVCACTSMYYGRNTCILLVTSRLAVFAEHA